MIIKEAVLNKSQMRDAISLAQELLYNPQEVQDIITDVTGSEYGSIEDIDVDEVYDQTRQYIINLLSDEDNDVTDNAKEDLIDAFDINVRVIYESQITSDLPIKVDNFLQDFVQVTGKLSYGDIMKFGEKWKMIEKTNQTIIKKLIQSAKRVMKDYSELDMYEIYEESPEFKKTCDQIIRMVKSLEEDTVRKSNGKWTNRGKNGEEHGEFKTKKQADAQRKAMFANGYKGEDLGYDSLEDKYRNKFTIQEGIDDYEIYTIALDIAIPKGREDLLRRDSGPLGKLYSKLSSALISCGYEMAGDYIEYEKGNTEIYVDSEYEFFED